MKKRENKVYESDMLDKLVHLSYPVTTLVYVLLLLTLAYHLFHLFSKASWPSVTLKSIMSISHRISLVSQDWKGAGKILNWTVNFLMSISIIYVLLLVIILLLSFTALTDAFAAKAKKRP